MTFWNIFLEFLVKYLESHGLSGTCMLAHILGAWSYDPCLLCLLSVYSLHCLPFSSSSFWRFSFGRFLDLLLISLNSHDRQLLGDGRNVLWGLSRPPPRPPKTSSPTPRANDICFQDLQREDNRSWGLCGPTSLQEHGRGAPIVFFQMVIW